VKNKLLLIVSLFLAIAMVFAIVVPISANIAPWGAGKSTILISIGPSGTYKVGQIIHYSITVEVPLTSGGQPCCLQTDNHTTFTDPHGNVQTLTTIPSLLPGEYVTFTHSSATYHQYSPQAGQPTRQQLVDALDAGGTMPVSPTYADNSSLYAGPYALLDYTVATEDIHYDSGAAQYRVTAHSQTSNTLGAHISSGNDSAAASNSISHQIEAGTEVHIHAGTSPVNKGTGTTLVVTEKNIGGIPFTSPHIVILKNTVAFLDLTNNSASYPVGTIFSEDVTTNGILDINETWTWSNIPTGNLDATTAFQADGHGIAPGNGVLQYTDITHDAGYELERESVTVNVNSPSTDAGIIALPSFLPAGGGTVTLTVTEENDGQVDLGNIVMTVRNNVDSTVYTLNKSAYYVSGDTLDDGILKPLETWTWSITGVPVTETTVFTVYGDGTYGTNPVIHVNYQSNINEMEDATVDVQPPHDVPASNNWTIGLLIAGFAGAIVLLRYRKSLWFRN
jgi:hypothetical protein